MNTNPFSITDEINIANYQPINRLIEKVVSQVSGLKQLCELYETDLQLSTIDQADRFIDHSLSILGISYSTEQVIEQHVAKSGSLIVVANHPFGGIDGLILAKLIRKIRPDVKILVNGLLNRIPAISDLFINVDPINPGSSVNQNAIGLKQSIKWVKDGGCLIVFPAGEVSHLNLWQHRVTDPKWNPTIARIIQLSKANVLPVFFEGKNSIKFQLVGLIHPLLRTLLLPREVLNKSNSKINVLMGKPINYSRIKNTKTDKLISFLRLSTDALQRKPSKKNKKPTQNGLEFEDIAPSVPTSLLQYEIDFLPHDQILYQTDKMKVFYAYSDQIPWGLKEIGLLREISFREVGEGTGKAIDLDQYDQYYIHLCLWDKEQQKIVGAYRLGLVDHIVKKYGIKGLYSYSLFKYTKKQLLELGTAIEMGRSFIRAEYQRSPAALSLLWKGIGLFVSQQASYTTLFGPVSISNDYHETSRKFIVDCMRSSCLMTELSNRIKPRNPYRYSSQTPWQKTDLKSLDDINQISDVISQLEQGERGIPILIKQYMRLGGRFLEFNIDENFNNALDGLIVVDLRQTERSLLDFFMGKNNAQFFLDHISIPIKRAS